MAAGPEPHDLCSARSVQRTHIAVCAHAVQQPVAAGACCIRQRGHAPAGALYQQVQLCMSNGKMSCSWKSCMCGTLHYACGFGWSQNHCKSIEFA